MQNVKDQHQKTTNELANLAAARKTPDTPAATGQPLTHYHSFFAELLSWNNPRESLLLHVFFFSCLFFLTSPRLTQFGLLVIGASAIAYATIVSLIFASRYLDVLRWGFKLTWMVLGVTIAAEVTGKLVLNNGLTSQVRPRKYYVLPRETLDSMIGDMHELINFFVIEAQRIVFAENISSSVLVSAFPYSYSMWKDG